MACFLGRRQQTSVTPTEPREKRVTDLRDSISIPILPLCCPDLVDVTFSGSIPTTFPAIPRTRTTIGTTFKVSSEVIKLCEFSPRDEWHCRFGGKGLRRSTGQQFEAGFGPGLGQ
jgi:hypothetical protein